MNIIAFSIKYLQNEISIKVISFLRQTKTVTFRYGFISLSIPSLKYGKTFKGKRSYSHSSYKDYYNLQNEDLQGLHLCPLYIFIIFIGVL